MGSGNEIKDLVKMKEIVIDAVYFELNYKEQYATWKKVSKSEASTYVNMYFDKAVEEYNRTYVRQIN